MPEDKQSRYATQTELFKEFQQNQGFFSGKTKQVIVIRADLGLTPGRLAAQVAHASLSFLTKYGQVENDTNQRYYATDIPNHAADEVDAWLKHSFRKVVLVVNSRDELMEVVANARRKHLLTNVVNESTLATETCVAIGPHYIERFAGVSDHLKLYK